MINIPNVAAQRAATLARFALSRVTEAFHDEMLGTLPPAHISGMPGFCVCEAVTEDVHAQFIDCNGRFYGENVAVRDPATWITHARIAAFDAAQPNAAEFASYPDEAGEAAA